VFPGPQPLAGVAISFACFTWNTQHRQGVVVRATWMCDTPNLARRRHVARFPDREHHPPPRPARVLPIPAQHIRGFHAERRHKPLWPPTGPLSFGSGAVCECSTRNSTRPLDQRVPTGGRRPDLVPRGTVAGSEAAAIGAAPARAAVERTTHVRARASRRRGRRERGAASFGSGRRSRRGRANVAYPCDLSEQGAFCGDPGAAGVLRGTGLDLIERLVAVPRHP
jgi:hypothetical protein